ncbi:hypothetical protein EKK58_02520 [Candidatus Dependentiae bacterium]|nr:MAG: hypothetical protein EKK58_02520 [Candidatus Dependentiae bacterium]
MIKKIKISVRNKAIPRAYRFFQVIGRVQCIVDRNFYFPFSSAMDGACKEIFLDKVNKNKRLCNILFKDNKAIEDISWDEFSWTIDSLQIDDYDDYLYIRNVVDYYLERDAWKCLFPVQVLCSLNSKIIFFVNVAKATLADLETQVENLKRS